MKLGIYLLEDGAYVSVRDLITILKSSAEAVNRDSLIANLSEAVATAVPKEET